MELSNDLLTGATEIGAYIKKSPRATYHLIEKGQIPTFRIGNKIHALKSELNARFRSAATNG